MAEKKSLEERYADEVLTDNSALNHYSQCKNCAFRDKRLIGDEEYGYDKSVCRIYGSRTASTLKASDGKPFFSYTPIEANDKPQGVYDNTEKCEYYEKE